MTLSVMLFLFQDYKQVYIR